MKKETEKPTGNKEISWDKLLIGTVVVFFLLLFAVLIGTIPSILKKPTLPIQPANASTSQWLQIVDSGLTPNVFPAPGAQTQRACQVYLLTGSEKYDYSYLLSNEETSMNLSMSSVVDAQKLVRTTDMKISNLQDAFNKVLQQQLQNTSQAQVPAISLPDMEMLFVAKLNDQFQCMSASLKMVAMGKETNQNVTCADIQDVSKICADQLTDLGTEQITIAAGTFNAKKYLTTDNSTIWISETMPLLLKSASEGTIIELTSYQRKG